MGGGVLKLFGSNFKQREENLKKEKKGEWGEMLGWSGNIILTPDELSYSPNRYIATLW